MDKKIQLNLVKKYQIALRRLYTTSPSKEILTLVGTNKNNIMPMYNIDNRAKGASLHFSLLKLNTLEPNDVVNKLINLCNKNIDKIYGKYLI